ncbi:alpha-1-inhibitor 3-like [Gastrophryne carolinensis]
MGTAILVKLHRVAYPAVCTYLDSGPGNSVSENVTLELPRSYVAGSEKAFIRFTGDIMASAISNVGDLLAMSYGCGEQNMAQYDPNVNINDYLTTSGQMTPELKEKAKKFMESGRDRQMNYQHADGSFSAFGKNDKEGTFVLKTLIQSKNHVYIDEEHIDKGLNWLKNQQKEDGSFQERGRLLNNALKGGVDNGIQLSAYITISLLEAGVDVDDLVVKKAMQFIRSEPVEEASLSTLALKAYAFTLANYTEDRKQVLQLLNKKANKEDGLLYWSQDVKPHKASYWSKPKLVDVEITAYTLLSFAINPNPTTQDIANMAPTVRWLSKQQNANGGFSSTQDTVVGLQALACYASLISSKAEDVAVEVTSDKGFHQRMAINRDNCLLLHTVTLPRVSDKYLVTVNGTGTAYMQVVQRHHAPPAVKEAAFSLEVKTQCMTSKLLKITIQFWYNGTRAETNMVLVEINMLSGYKPQEDSIGEVKKVLGVKRVENKENLVNIYIEKVTSEQQVLELVAERSVLVTGLKPAIVKLFDYYIPDEKNIVSYLSECQ